MSNTPYKYQEFTETGVAARIAEASERGTGLDASQIKNHFDKTLGEVKELLQRLVDKKMVNAYYFGNRKNYWVGKHEIVPQVIVKSGYRTCFTPEMSTAHGLRLRAILEAPR
jgi:hypothetical protein